MGTGRYAGGKSKLFSDLKVVNRLIGKKININNASFSGHNVPKSVVQEGLSRINTLLTFLGLRQNSDATPTVAIKSSAKLGIGTIGNCSRAGDINLNSFYFDTEKSGLDHAGTWAHEYAHAIEAQFGRIYLSNWADQSHAWNDCSFARQIINNALKKMGKAESSWKSLAKTTSSYATTDHSECLAEVAKNFVNPKHTATAFETAVMQSFRTEVRKLNKYKKNGGK